MDEETGISFAAEQTVGGVAYRCLGAGVRTAHFLGFIPVKVYAVTLCLEPAGVKAVAAAAAGRSADKLEKDPSFFDAILAAPGGKLAIEHFVRTVPQDKITEALKESLGKVLSPEKVGKLTALVTLGPKENQEMRLFSQGATLTIDIAGTSNRIEDAEIAQKLFLVFLGPDSVTPSLKKSIAHQAAAGL